MKKYLVILPLLAVAGCSSNTAYVATSNDASSAASTRPAQAPAIATAPSGETAVAQAQGNASSDTASPANGTKVPPGMAMSGRMTLTPTPDLDKKIAAAQKGDKKKLAQAYAERGTFRMNDTSASPKVIYRAALEDYRQALKLDPSNKEAQTNKALIESIYKSMGRPIPS